MINQMKTIKVIIFSILSIIGIILCFVLAINVFGYQSNVANGITETEIKKIEMGMTIEEVISILGKPFEIENLDGAHDLSCKNPKFLEMKINKNTDIVQVVDSFFDDTNYCCDAYKKSIPRWGKRITLIYTKRPCFLISLFTSYPTLWVHLDSNYCVHNVYAKQYEFMDDICIYSLSWKMDTTTFEEIQGEIDLYINDELFNKCFEREK
jgi:hypothetical protein